jgi:hypothetical protein
MTDANDIVILALRRSWGECNKAAQTLPHAIAELERELEVERAKLQNAIDGRDKLRAAILAAGGEEPAVAISRGYTRPRSSPLGDAQVVLEVTSD